MLPLQTSYIGHMRRGGKPNRLTLTTASILMLTANRARCAIIELADVHSWETIAREMIQRMSGDEAREFVEDFKAYWEN